MEIKYLKLDPRLGAEFPSPHYATSGSAGIDLIACIDAPLTLEPNHTHLIPSGIALALESSQAAMIFPRSGLGHKYGIILGNTVGIIDSDYRGQIFVSLWNRSENAYTVQSGDRIAQLVIMPIIKPTWVQVTELPPTERGEGGFGSTGS